MMNVLETPEKVIYRNCLGERLIPCSFLSASVPPFCCFNRTTYLSVPWRPTNSAIPPGNFEMLSRLNKLDLADFYWLTDNLT